MLPWHYVMIQMSLNILSQGTIMTVNYISCQLNEVSNPSYSMNFLRLMVWPQLLYRFVLYKIKTIPHLPKMVPSPSHRHPLKNHVFWSLVCLILYWYSRVKKNLSCSLTEVKGLKPSSQHFGLYLGIPPRGG